MSVRLHVNVDHVATLRNARGTLYPSPARAAEMSLAAGADGITAHLREDRRHIVDADLPALRALCAQSRRIFNLEMAATDGMVKIALAHGPDVCTLVPERREERTTEGGLDVRGGGAVLAARVRTLLDAGIKVSLFIAADAETIDRSRELGAQQIELHTGEYAHGCPEELDRLGTGANRAHALGLEVAAGHGLTRDNVPALVALPEIVELNIGHALVGDAIFAGLNATVQAYRDAIVKGVAMRGAKK